MCRHVCGHVCRHVYRHVCELGIARLDAVFVDVRTPVRTVYGMPAHVVTHLCIDIVYTHARIHACARARTQV